MPALAARSRRLEELEAAARKRTRAILVAEGIGLPEVGVLNPSDFPKINVDQVTYQRHRTNEVNELIHVLRNGGKFPQPIAVAVRPDGSWYLVDGLQRFSAAVECDEPLPMLLYKSTGARAEAVLFQILNRHVALQSDTTVKAWQGPGAEMIRAAAAHPSHGLHNQVRFGTGAGQGKAPYSAALLIRCMTEAASGIIASGKIQDVCSRLDHALATQPLGPDRAQAILHMIPNVFPRAHPPKILPVHGLGLIAFERWRHKVVLPSDGVCAALRRIAWDTYFDGSSLKFLPSVKEAIARRWR